MPYKDSEVPEDERLDVRGMKKPERRLSPDEAADLVAKLRAAREKGKAITARQQAALLADPLNAANLPNFRRAEWEVVLRFLAAPDTSLKTLAQMLGFKRWQSVQQILRRPHVAKAIATIRQKQVEALIRGDFGATALLKQSQVKAAQKVVETIDDPLAGKKTNLAAAESVLDRTGLGKATAVAHHHVHEILRHFTQDEIDAYGQKGVVPERFQSLFAQLEGPTEPPPED